MSEYADENQSWHTASDREASKEAGRERHNESEAETGDTREVKKRVIDYVKSWLSDQKILAGVKMRKTSTVFRETGRRLNAENQKMFSEYILKSADRMQELSEYLEDRPLEGIPDDLSRFAHKRPLLFIGGSIALGIIVAQCILSTPSSSHTENQKTKRNP
jgi:hypothetical protein